MYWIQLQSTYDKMGETGVKMMDNPTQVTPDVDTLFLRHFQMVFEMIKETPVALRGVVFIVFVLFFASIVWLGSILFVCVNLKISFICSSHRRNHPLEMVDSLHPYFCYRYYQSHYLCFVHSIHHPQIQGFKGIRRRRRRSHKCLVGRFE